MQMLLPHKMQLMQLMQTEVELKEEIFNLATLLEASIV